MDRFRHGRQRARGFFFGTYPGAPVDYVLALAAVAAMMLVLIAGQMG